MKLLNIKLLFIPILLALAISVLSSEVQAAIPVKRVCVVNENNQPLLYTDGQGLIVKHNNAFNNYMHRRAGADGCLEFPNSTKHLSSSVTVKYSDEASGVEEISHEKGDIGCASGPFGFKVVLPKAWEEQWECQTVGSANGPFPCCRNDREENCNKCNVHGTWNGTEFVGSYGDEISETSHHCYCSRGVSSEQTEEGAARDKTCPVCFHNNGQRLDVRLQCKKKKDTQSIALEQPRPEQFGPPSGYSLDCLGSRVCSYTDQKEGEQVKCTKQNEPGSGTRRFLLENYRNAALKYTKIQADGETLESPVYVTECVMEGTNESDAKYVCTTGSAQIDAQLGLQANGQVSYSYLSSTYGYKGQIQDEKGQNVAQPMRKLSQLQDIYEWETTTTQPVRSTFAIFYDEKFSSAQESGDSRSQLQRTLSTVGACTLHIDPIGRVFDNHTLEPIPGVNMSLSRGATKIGTQTTKKDGQFSFYVNPGTYRLLPTVEGYIFPILNTVHAKAAAIYSNFYQGADIKVDRAIVYTDVPMDPVDKKTAEAGAKSNNPEIMEYFQSINKQTNEYLVQGLVSHPKSTVTLNTDIANPFNKGEINRSRVIARTSADKHGRFSLSFRLDDLKQNETVGSLEVVKPKELYPYGGGTKSIVLLNPVLNNVKGYAYDSNGYIIPGAVVAVNIPVFDKPVYQVSANEEGYFEIPSEKLPPMPYTLTFTTLGNKTEEVDTRRFIAQNAHKNTNLAQYYAANEPSFMDRILGESTMYAESFTTSSDSFFVNNRPAVLAGLFLFMLISAIPLYNLYSKDEHKRRK